MTAHKRGVGTGVPDGPSLNSVSATVVRVGVGALDDPLWDFDEICGVFVGVIHE